MHGETRGADAQTDVLANALDNPLTPRKKKNKIISVICASVSSICHGSYSKAWALGHYRKATGFIKIDPANAGARWKKKKKGPRSKTKKQRQGKNRSCADAAPGGKRGEPALRPGSDLIAAPLPKKNMDA